MLPSKVLVRDFQRTPLVRYAVERARGIVYVTDTEGVELAPRLIMQRRVVGFPSSDVFQIPDDFNVEKPVEWYKLRRWPGDATRS